MSLHFISLRTQLFKARLVKSWIRPCKAVLELDREYDHGLSIRYISSLTIHCVVIFIIIIIIIHVYPGFISLSTIASSVNNEV